MATGARLRLSSSSSQRKLSDNVELPKNYPNLSANGISSGTSTGGKQLTSVQNLPAVLTDPRKGKIFSCGTNIFRYLVSPLFCEISRKKY